jgi:hypothetical protein
MCLKLIGTSPGIIPIPSNRCKQKIGYQSLSQTSNTRGALGLLSLLSLVEAAAGPSPEPSLDPSLDPSPDPSLSLEVRGVRLAPAALAFAKFAREGCALGKSLSVGSVGVACSVASREGSEEGVGVVGWEVGVGVERDFPGRRAPAAFTEK